MTDLSGANNADIAQLRAQLRALKEDSIPNSQQRVEIANLNQQIAEAMRSKKVETQPIGLTISSDGQHVEQTDLHVPDQNGITRMEKYKDKQTVINTFVNIPISKTTGKPMTEQEFKEYVDNLKKERDKAKKKMEDAVALTTNTEYFNNLNLVQRTQLHKNAEALTERYMDLAAEYDLAKLNYDAMRGKGATKDITKAAGKNAEDMQNVNDLTHAFPNDTMKDAYLQDHPNDKDKVVVLGDKEYNALLQLQAYGQNVINEAKKALDNGEITEEQFNQINEFYGKYVKMVREDSSIDTRLAQEVIVDYTGADCRLNLDEKSALAKTIYAKDKSVQNLVKDLGFGVETGNSQRWKAALAAGVPALIANMATWAIFGTKTDTDSQSVPYEKFEGMTDPKIAEKIINGQDAYGNNVIEHIVQITQSPITSTQHANAIADATASLPWLAQLAAPVAAGLFAFFTCNPKTENCFNGKTVEAVLEEKHLNSVEGDGAKLVVDKIKNLEITGCKWVDDRIKVAVLEQAIGKDTVAPNLREVLAAYDMMVQVKAEIDKIPAPKPDQTTTTTETTEPDIDPTPPPVVEEDPCVEEKFVDDGFNVTHVSGMYPYGIAERLGIPKKYQKEFVEMYRKDNGMDRSGSKYNKTPYFRTSYTFSDGTTFDLGKTKEEVQEILNKPWSSGKGNGPWRATDGRQVEKRSDGYYYCPNQPEGHKDKAGRKLTQDEVNRYVK
ncbi:MAG: hypothetical protein E7Z87_04655 [Cyanobacteria bacterium SIG26]|nr:hypothetical protein [Cyanobacteria bacterium SIG26]